MSNIQAFNDRFTYANPSLAAVDVNTLSDASLEALAPAVKEMAAEVRRYSVLLKRKTTVEIYNVITDSADPRISLVLAAARDKAGLRLFSSLELVKQVMFGPFDATDTTFISETNNIFVQGIRRVSAALTASILIGQLAQITEQAQHSQVLEAQALKDLDRILQVPDLLTANNLVTSSAAATTNQSFFFQQLDFNLNSVIQVDIFMSSSSGGGWVSVGSFSGEFNTGEIVAAIADTINSLTLVSQTGNILASPILSGKNTLHRLEFNARSRDSVVASELITVKIRHLVGGVNEPLPFKWGVDVESIQAQPVNSCLITVLQGKASTAVSSKQTLGAPTVLYFRRANTNSTGDVLSQSGTIISEATWSNKSLVYRVSPTSTTNTTLPIVRSTTSDPTAQLLLDKERHSQAALSLLNSLYSSKADTRALGAIIRNDDISQIGPITGLELVAFSATNPQTWIVLDIIDIPDDIEMATGNLTGPLTSFSNKPRSIRVTSHYEFRLNQSSLVSSTSSGKPKIISFGESHLLEKYKDAQYREQNSFSYTNTPFIR